MYDDDKDDDDHIKVELEARMYEVEHGAYPRPKRPASRPPERPASGEDAPKPEADDRSGG
jgi:hypothetical protein